MKLDRLLLNIKLIFYVSNKELKLNNTDTTNILQRRRRTNSLTFQQKNSYINSSEWKTMQKVWLYDKGYRCQMFPFLVLGQHKLKKSWWNDSFYGKFAVHHVTKKAYENLGNEKLDNDVIVLSKFAHKWIYHYLLSFGKKKAGDQKFIKFANPLQITMNYWCFLNNWLKLLLFLLAIYFVL